MKKRIMAGALLVLLLVSLCGTALAATVKTQASDGSLWVRSGPGTEFSKVTYVKNGQSITVLETGSVWCKIKVDSSGKVGYIKGKYIVSGGGGGTGNTYDVGRVVTKYAKSRVNLRKGPSTDYAIAGSYGRGSIAKITGASGNWYIVHMRDGNSGYMSKNYVSIGVSAKTTANVNLRSGPGTDYGIIKVLPKGTSVTVVAVFGNWVKVNVGSGSGFLYSKYVSF